MQVNEQENVKLIPEEEVQSKPESKQTDEKKSENLNDFEVIKAIFKCIHESNLKSSENTDLILNKISEILKNNCGNEKEQNCSKLSTLILNELKTPEKKEDCPPIMDFQKIVSEISEQNSQSILAKVLSTLFCNLSKITEHPDQLILCIEALTSMMMNLNNFEVKFREKNEKLTQENVELAKENENLKKMVKKFENGNDIAKWIKEIREIKNYSQSMISIYEKETEKMRIKLKAYKKAVNQQLDNLHSKLGFSTNGINDPIFDPDTNGDNANPALIMDHDSGLFSVNEQLNKPNFPSELSNPFDHNQNFQKNGFFNPIGMSTIRKDNHSGFMGENLLTPSVVRKGQELNQHSNNLDMRINLGNNEYQNFFTPIKNEDNPSNVSHNLLMKRNSEIMMQSSVPEDPKLKNFDSVSKQSVTSKKSRNVKRQDLRYWTLKKAIFCWDGDFNLEIVYKEFVKHFGTLLGDLISPKEPVIEALKIKAFTKSTSRPNLLAVKVTVNPRYKSIIEQTWKNGSPSNFFKLKIDLIKNNSITFKSSAQNLAQNRGVKNMKKFPARYNFSQATYNFHSLSVNKETINEGILTYLKQIGLC